MRARRSVKIDRCTGERTVTTELLPAAGFKQRIASLKTSAELAMIGGAPIEARSLDLQCNGCGTKVPLDYDEPELPAGWVERDDGDFCPRCR